MECYPSFIDVDIDDVYKDVNKAIYVLHYVNEELFSKKEIQDICFSLKITLNTLEKMIESKELSNNIKNS